MRFDIVLNNLAGFAWTTNEIKMTSDGTPWRPLVHVADICEAIVSALTAPQQQIHNEVFNVGDDTQNYRVREIAEVVRKIFEGASVSFSQQGGDNRSYRISFQKIRRHLPEFQCRWTAERGARELEEIFRRVRMSKEMFSFRAFTRLEQLKHLLATGQIDDSFYWRSYPEAST
jgi:nucleoside-diphosphate-sugar epimerase